MPFFLCVQSPSATFRIRMAHFSMCFLLVYFVILLVCCGIVGTKPLMSSWWATWKLMGKTNLCVVCPVCVYECVCVCRLCYYCFLNRLHATCNHKGKSWICNDRNVRDSARIMVVHCPRLCNQCLSHTSVKHTKQLLDINVRFSRRNDENCCRFHVNHLSLSCKLRIFLCHTM